MSDRAEVAEPLLVTGTFEGFVRDHGQRIIRFTTLLTGDRGHAEDLVQDVLVRMDRRWRTIEEPAAYARKAIIRAHIRQRLRRSTAELPAGLGGLPEVAVADGGQQRAEQAAMWEALGRVPRRQRAVLVLRYYEGLTEAEIAACLRCSTGTVKSQASKGLARLRAVLGSEQEL